MAPQSQPSPVPGGSQLGTVLLLTGWWLLSGCGGLGQGAVATAELATGAASPTVGPAAAASASSSAAAAPSAPAAASATAPAGGSAVPAAAPPLASAAVSAGSSPPPAPAPTAAAPSSGWGWPLQSDAGMRKDKLGDGYFLAYRYHGKHNGVDLLAPVGTPALAACGGQGRSGFMGGYGRFVQLVCPLPAALAGEEGLYASLLYAHLRTTELPGSWTAISPGQVIGEVGKTGNAVSHKMMPHIHLELLVHKDEHHALREQHLGRDQSDNEAAERFFAALEARCSQPQELRSPKSVRRARRADPFVVLMCLGVAKPPYEPPAQLQSFSVPWSKHYKARFDLDAGRIKLPAP